MSTKQMASRVNFLAGKKKEINFASKNLFFSTNVDI